MRNSASLVRLNAAIGAAQDGAAQVGAAQEGAAQVGVAQVGVVQVGAAQVAGSGPGRGACISDASRSSPSIRNERRWPADRLASPWPRSPAPTLSFATLGVVPFLSDAQVGAFAVGHTITRAELVIGPDGPDAC